MYSVVKSIDLDFAHHVSGHMGECINIHGHTWRFELCIASEELDPSTGFVADFKLLRTKILQPVHDLLDHSLLLPRETYDKAFPALEDLGRILLSTRRDARTLPRVTAELDGLSLQYPGGMKVVVAENFNPTSERLAEWFFHYASDRAGELVEGWRAPNIAPLQWVRVYESLHPVECYAEFCGVRD